MAQGKLKRKSSTKKGKRKASRPPVRRRRASKPLPRKSRSVVPKKAAKRKASKQQKNLQKKVTECIEQDLIQRAAKDGNELRVVSSEELSRVPEERKDILRKC